MYGELKQRPLPSRLGDVPGLFWKPGESFLTELASELRDKRVLEVFAGNGYLAALLAARGVSIHATSVFSGHDCHEYGIYHPVTELDAIDAVIDLHSETDVLLMSWPTTTPRAFLAAAFWQQLKNAPVCFIGEVTDVSKGQLGGCATDEFHECFVVEKAFASYRGRAWEQALLGRMDLSRLSQEELWAPALEPLGASK